MIREHVAPALYYLEVHLLYASLVCLAAWVLTSLWKDNYSAKYWIWVATAINFVVPLAGFFNRFGASRLSWATQLGGLDEVGFEISRNLSAGAVLLGIWVCGAGFMAVRLFVRLSRARRRELVGSNCSDTAFERRASASGIPVTLSAGARGPSVAGVLRPFIYLPLGIDALLTQRELDAVLIHEVIHAKRRDNLIALIHEIALCVLWFHPLVWLVGSRLAIFKELSCDDAVLAKECGRDLVGALAKLADRGEAQLLRAGAGTFFSHRLTRLQASQPCPASRAASLALFIVFSALLLTCVAETVAHTPGCFNLPVY